MHAMDAKTQKIELDPNFFLTDESFGGRIFFLPAKISTSVCNGTVEINS